MNKTNFESKGSMLTVTRTFDAEIDLVWRAWTEAELLDQWWAPKPWKSETSYMDFRTGGYRLYAMVGPEGERHMGRTNYLSIDVHESFSGEDAFCDADGNVKMDLPVAVFKNQFVANGGKTEVTVVTEYASEAHLQQVIQMGMKEGLSMAYENLDELFKALKINQV